VHFNNSSIVAGVFIDYLKCANEKKLKIYCLDKNQGHKLVIGARMVELELSERIIMLFIKGGIVLIDRKYNK
jgi:hypothetical protein